MKKIILTLVLFFLLLTHLSAQWEILHDGSDLKGLLNTIDFVNEDVGWIAGIDNGTLLVTSDGGENWSSIPFPENHSIRHIDFLDLSKGWVVGSGNVQETWYNFILKTTDGGYSWNEQFSSTDFGMDILFAIDDQNCFTVGGNKIFKTSDGGNYWFDVSPNLSNMTYNSVWFQDSQSGVVVGSYYDGNTDKGAILKTNNGGVSWDAVIVNEFNSIYDLQSPDKLNGYFRANNDTVSFICKTEDLCGNWEIITQIMSPDTKWNNPIKSFQFFDNFIAFAIMDDNISPYNVMKSVDGGNSWNKLASVGRGLPLGTIYFNKVNRGVILSVSPGRGRKDCIPILFLTSDSGMSWMIKNFNMPITKLSFFNASQGFITGGYFPAVHYSGLGVALSTIDGGKTLEIKYYVRAPQPNLIFTNHSDGFLSINSSRGGITSILKTYDLGLNWSVVYKNNSDSLGFQFSINDFGFMNDQTGFVVGKYSDTLITGAGILGTTDGGNSWQLSWKFTESDLFSTHFVSASGWGVGESGLIVKYTPQTGWVKKTSVTNLPLNKVFFIDDNNGWIAGGYDYWNGFKNIFLRTTDGGENWNSVPDIPYFFRDFKFIDNNFGWAIGYDSSGAGGILKSTDGGSTWTIDAGNLTSKLNAIDIKDNCAWTVGDNGLILRNTNIVSVGTDNNNSYPTDFVLEQNFPNPFNPSTKIVYSIPIWGGVRGGSANVKLIIYDVLGREIAVVVNEEQPPGLYEVEFDGTNLSSGIYLLRLKTRNLDAVKKMILLK